MSIIISNIKIKLEEDESKAIDIAKKKLNRVGVVDTDIDNISVYKKSLDARKVDKFYFVISVLVNLHSNESEIVKAISDNFVVYKENTTLNIKPCKNKPTKPIVIIGFGPCGIFCADLLAQNGYYPIVFERGSAMQERINAVEGFWSGGALDVKSNVQYGEGGAGTFSDGKLTTRISDNRCDYVLKRLHENGAPEEILQSSKPHIGTDKLRGVIETMRKNIIGLGGEIHFDSKLDDINIKNGKICSIVVNGNEIETDTVVLAIGHSARDTFSMLYDKGIDMENKSFSVGLRIEQLQETIDKGLYGKFAGHKNLPVGEYQLSHRMKNRAVYTFCMCPGGVVVPSSSTENSVVTNGMSYHARDGKNANSALVVSVDKNDFGNNPLDGVKFQEQLEQKAFTLGGGNYSAPACTVGKLQGMSNNIGDVTPSYSRGITECDMSTLFNKDIYNMLRLGLQVFDKKIKGFSSATGVLTGVESRTSSPVRILRNDEMQSVNIEGLYPAGEGAGYAGGIVSACVDGLKIAEKIAEKLN